MFAALLVVDVAIAKQSTEPDSSQQRSVREAFDLGVGLGLGLPLPGVKLRALGTTGSGLVAGVDLDLGSLILLNVASASVLVGGAADLGDRRQFRAYAKGGCGYGAAASILFASGWESPIVSGGTGVEYKPAPWFGIGLEGQYHQVLSEDFGFPSAQLTATFYAI